MEIVVHGFKRGPIFSPVDTWIRSQKGNPEIRIIYTNKVWMAQF